MKSTASSPLIERARDLVEDLTRRQVEAQVATATRFTQAFAAGVACEALATASKTDILEVAAAATAGRLRINQQALSRLAAEMACGAGRELAPGITAQICS